MKETAFLREGQTEWHREIIASVYRTVRWGFSFASQTPLNFIQPIHERKDKPMKKAIALVLSLILVFAAVSDPVGAGLVESLEAPGANITGTSDFLDTAAVLNLIFAANPDVKKVGLLYNPSEDASAAPVAAAKEILGAKGVEVKEYTGSNAADVILAAEAIAADGMDAVFTPTDNTIMSAELSIYEILAEAKIPHYTGADSFALNGAFLGYGVDYANLGRETADMIAAVLLDGADPATTPVKTFDNGTATVNTETCAAIGFDFETIKTAFAPFCTSVQEITTAEVFE